MKIILLLTTLLLLTSTVAFSNEVFNETIAKANSLKLEQKYAKAIEFYIKAIKLEKNSDTQIKLIYFDIADCFYKSGKNNMAIKVLKFSIYRYGAVKEDFVNTTRLDKEFSIFAFDEIEEKYSKYRTRYVEKYQKELKIQENSAYAVKPS